MKKLYSNLGPAARAVLGIRQYFYLLTGAVLSLPAILLSKKLTSLDKWMSKELSIRFLGYQFKIDCRAVDSKLGENSYTFGLIREIYIQSCYRSSTLFY